MLSSPDPLNDDPIYTSPIKSRFSGLSRQSQPRRSASPRKQTFELDVGNQKSPQKIRVTIEADSSDKENAGGASARTQVSPTKKRALATRRTERTVTTTVPVKGLEDSEDDVDASPSTTPKGNRGRPRRSNTPVKSKPRNLTPGGSRRRTLGEIVDGDDEEDWDFKIGQNVDIGRKRRSRSRSIKGPKLTAIAIGDKIPQQPPVARRPPEESSERVVRQASILSDDSQRSRLSSRDSSYGDNAPLDKQSARSMPTKAQSTAEATQAEMLQAGLPPSARSKASLSSARGLDELDRQELDHAGDDDGACVYAVDENEHDNEFREFDTIMESEEFSMISVDSVPSLREHLSSPAVHESPLVRTDSVQDKPIIDSSHAQAHNSPPLMSTEPVGDVTQKPNLHNTDKAEISEAPSRPSATSASLLNSTRLSNMICSDVLSARPSPAAVNDSFSSVPPSILEAATPRPNHMLRQLFKRDHLLANHDDSFSSVPSAILEAATPARYKQTKSTVENVSRNEMGRRVETAPVGEKNMRPASREQESSRMLTPEGTPPPGETSSVDPDRSSQNKTSRQAHMAPSFHRSTNLDTSLISPMRSSPPSMIEPRFTYTSQLRQHREPVGAVTHTPAVAFSSPSLPPLQQHNARGSIASETRGSIQELETTVRAGRALQDIVVPPSSDSSRSRSQSLAEPFRSPESSRKSSDASKTRSLLSSPRSSQHANVQTCIPEQSKPLIDLLSGFSSGTRKDLRKSFLAGQQLADDAHTVISRVAEDPFLTSGAARPSAEVTASELALGGLGRKSVARTSMNKLVGPFEDNVSSEDAMSWKAESPVASSNTVPLERRSSHEQATKSSPAIQSLTRNLLARSREEQWVKERRAVSDAINDAPVTDALVVESSSDGDLSAEQDEDELDIWLEEAQNSSQLEAEAARKSPHEAEQLKDDVSSQQEELSELARQDGRSFAHGDEFADGMTTAVDVFGASKDLPKAARESRLGLAANRKLDFKGSPASRPVSTQVSAELSGLAEPLRPVVTAQDSSRPQQAQTRRSTPLDLSALFGSSPVKLGSAEQTPLVPTNMNAQPTIRDPKAAIGKPSFAVRPQPTVQDRINEILAQDEPSADWDRTEEPSYEDSVSKEPTAPADSSSLLIYPLLNNVATIPKSAQTPSPKKGIIRTSLPGQSPTKNVVWVGLSSSPTAEVLEASRRDISASDMTSGSSVVESSIVDLSATDQLMSRGAFSQQYLHQNSTLSSEDESTMTSLPATPRTPAPEPLSSRDWSKAHWKVLNSIFLDIRRSLPLSADLEVAYSTSKLLGKVVRADGEKMKIEAWHLDVVACFLDEVPGWDESTLITRVFGLVKGEERRSRKSLGVNM